MKNLQNKAADSESQYRKTSIQLQKKTQEYNALEDAYNDLENQFEELQSKQDERETDIKELLSQLRKQQEAQKSVVQNDTTPSPINDKAADDVEKVITALKQFKLGDSKLNPMRVNNVTDKLTGIEQKLNALSAIKEKNDQLQKLNAQLAQDSMNLQ